MHKLPLTTCCLLALSACAPITPFPQPQMPSPQTPSSSSGAPSSSLPSPSSPSIPSGGPSSPLPSPSPAGLPSAGLPLPSTPGMPSPPSASSTRGSADSTQTSSQGPADRSGDTGSGAEDNSGNAAGGWLEGEPRGTNETQGEWQTSNQTVPDNSGSERSGAATDAEKTSGTSNDSEADLALTEALEGLDGDILAERAVLRENEAAKTGADMENQPQAVGGRETNQNSPTVASPSTAQTARGRASNRPPPPKRGDDSVATDLPDAKDDDIIARQLREAAMQEADPVLKEKLWDEYRRYKKG